MTTQKTVAQLNCELLMSDEYVNKLPEAVQNSFTDTQLESIGKVMEATSWKKHRVDLRSSISLIFFSLFVTFSTLLGLLTLYLIKSAMGIDLFPHFSLGIWGWFKEVFSL